MLGGVAVATVTLVVAVHGMAAQAIGRRGHRHGRCHLRFELSTRAQAETVVGASDSSILERLTLRELEPLTPPPDKWVRAWAPKDAREPGPGGVPSQSRPQARLLLNMPDRLATTRNVSTQSFTRAGRRRAECGCDRWVSRSRAIGAAFLVSQHARANSPTDVRDLKSRSLVQARRRRPCRSAARREELSGDQALLHVARPNTRSHRGDPRTKLQMRPT